jgi:excisionase family DNA binding protein
VRWPATDYERRALLDVVLGTADLRDPMSVVVATAEALRTGEWLRVAYRQALPDRLLTVAEVASVFDVPTWRIAKWCQQGVLHPITTPGGHRRFTRDDIEALVVQQGVRGLKVQILA